MNEIKCETCKFLKIMSGDWVPYGSTNAQLPDEWECNHQWEEGNEENDWCNELIDSLMNGQNQNCPHYEELPRCPKHPDQYINQKYGCGKCEELLWEREEE